jgi:hypothetical protein
MQVSGSTVRREPEFFVRLASRQWRISGRRLCSVDYTSERTVVESYSMIGFSTYERQDSNGRSDVAC